MQYNIKISKIAHIVTEFTQIIVNVTKRLLIRLSDY